MLCFSVRETGIVHYTNVLICLLIHRYSLNEKENFKAEHNLNVPNFFKM